MWSRCCERRRLLVGGVLFHGRDRAIGIETWMLSDHAGSTERRMRIALAPLAGRRSLRHSCPASRRACGAPRRAEPETSRLRSAARTEGASGHNANGRHRERRRRQPFRSPPQLIRPSCQQRQRHYLSPCLQLRRPYPRRTPFWQARSKVLCPFPCSCSNSAKLDTRGGLELGVPVGLPHSRNLA